MIATTSWLFSRPPAPPRQCMWMLQPTSKMSSPMPCSVHPSPADGTAVTSVCPTAAFLMPLFGNQGPLVLVHQCCSTSDSPSLYIHAGHSLLTPGNGSPLSELCLMPLQASPSPMHDHVTCPAKPLTLKTGIRSLLPSLLSSAFTAYFQVWLLL